MYMYNYIDFSFVQIDRIVHCTVQRRNVQNFVFLKGKMRQQKKKKRKLKLNWDKLPRTGISHAKLLVGVVSWH